MYLVAAQYLHSDSLSDLTQTVDWLLPRIKLEMTKLSEFVVQIDTEELFMAVSQFVQAQIEVC